MSIEEIIKQKADERVEKFKNELKEQGIVLNEFGEMCLRTGIAYGISISALTLADVDLTQIINE